MALSQPPKSNTPCAFRKIASFGQSNIFGRLVDSKYRSVYLTIL